MTKYAPILSAEDEESDRIILRIAHTKAGIPNPIVFVSDGQAAVDYLAGNPPYQDRAAHPIPGLILLDLKMPRMDGFDVLGWLAGQRSLHLPVIILSSSSNNADVQKARRMGALDYLVKSPDLEHLATMFRDLAQKWLARD